MASKFANRLAGMKSSYNESAGAYNSMFGGSKVPEGVYVAQVQNAKLTESASSGKLMIAREFLITEGEFRGITVRDNMQLETEFGFVFMRRFFEMMGYEAPEDPVEIEDTVQAIVKDAAIVKIRLKHSGDFINISVTEVLEESAPKQETKQEQKEAPKTEKKQEPPKEASAGLPPNAGKEKKQKKATEPEPQKDDAELLEEVQAFCTAQGIEYEDSDTLEALKVKIDEYEYPAKELDESEIDLLNKLGLGGNITGKSA